jgi:pimeloyl-ACP methyl ester carboxylesterase
VDDQRTVEQVLAEHRAAGRFFSAAGIRSFARASGEGETVVLIHGLPASSFLYRKVIPELAARGFRALSFDWPGLGLADRPPDFDYSLAGLGGFAAAAVDSLGIDRYHLVVHDAGGPVGFELALLQQARVRSLTILNTMLEIDRIPFPGEVYARIARDGVGSLMHSPRVWQEIMFRVAVADRSALSSAEVMAYRDLALGDNDGATYLEIMRRVRAGHVKGRYQSVVDSRTVPYPIRILWGGRDPMLTLRRFGWKLLAATHLPSLTMVPARHYLQEDQAPVVAQVIAENAALA